MISQPHSSPRVPPRLEARDIGLTLDGARILDRVLLEARPGEFIGLIGPNGAGKSTLLRAISGLLRAEGQVRIEERDLRRLSARAIARIIAQVPQTTVLDFAFTSLEVVLMGRHPHLGAVSLEGHRDLEIAREAMAFTNTDQFAQRDVRTLSGGERQRVLIARALAQEPRLLLLDEPTANLDLHHQLQVLDLVKTLVAEGVTAIAAIHDLNLAANHCDRLYLLKQGRLLAYGRPWEVLTPANLQEGFGVRALVYTDPITDRLAINVVGHGSLAAPNANSSVSVHVVGGGGRGARAMFLLHEAGFRITASPLNEGDTDLSVARTLGIESTPIPAFAPIDGATHAQHLDLVRAAQVVVLCDVKVGAGNLLNLVACQQAWRLLLIEDTSLAERDFTGGEASRLYLGLRSRAQATSLATLVPDVARALALADPR